MLKPATPAPKLILASSSKYRAELLARLRLPFDLAAPEIDETPLPGETAQDLVQRLALAKARKLAGLDSWVLGSDQAAECAGRILGKPGHHAAAVEQLRWASGREVRFFTSVALVENQQAFQALDVTTVRFRALDQASIERYLAAEPAYDCAGSFKCEGLGITLFEYIENADPTALVGLPLIATSRLLRQAGFLLP